MKVFGRVVFYIVVSLIVLFLAAELALRFIMPTQVINDKISSVLSEQTGTKVTVGKISAGIFGVIVRDISFQIPSGQIASIKWLYARYNPFALIKKEVSIRTVIVKGVNVNIVKYKDGSLNIDYLIKNKPAAPQVDEPQKDSSLPVTLFVNQFQVEGSTLSFTDEAADTSYTLDDIFVNVFQFSLDKPFSVSTKMIFKAARGSNIFAFVPFGFTVYPNLKNLDLSQAAAELRLFVAQLKKASLTVKGNADNFKEPSISFNLEADNLSADMLAGIFDAPAFNIPQLKAEGKIKADIENSLITVESFSLDALSSFVNASGTADIKNNTFDIAGKFLLALDQIGAAVSLTAPYNLVGNIKGDIAFKEGYIRGTVGLNHIGATVEEAGTLSNLDADINIKSLGNISIPNIKGMLNGDTFTASASYLEKGKAADVNFNLKAHKLLVKQSTTPIGSAKKAQPAQNAAQSKPAAAQAWPLPPLNIKADVQIGSLNAPYINGDDIVLKADVKNVTPALDKTSGAMTLTTAEGQIKDIYKLTEANAVTKVLFLSLNVVSKVINALDVLDVLSTIGSAVAGGGDSASQVAPPQGQKIDGKLDFDSFNTSVVFNEGKTDVKNVNFVSDTFSFKVKGFMDFNTRKLDMTVNAAPGKHEGDGIMPLTLKIGGTVEQPKGSLSMLSSVASLLTQSIFNNALSNNLKRGFTSLSGIGGDTPVEVNTSPDAEVQIPLETDDSATTL